MANRPNYVQQMDALEVQQVAHVHMEKHQHILILTIAEIVVVMEE